ncbi:MAG TPA: tRNA uridine-5-carboxymethylaminomethyl(34) synthesis enzyme MnmG [Pseudobdellovibrionaceae bacterium]|nr:tRNA uridine-5-carboxymethylaminomethyl(34) synthesis enzyme MnmG [Pseudobdellovibrionaceae bacterium]
MRGFDFDVIVVGAGHAGLEAALASARSGLSTCLLTVNVDRIGYMSCNPSIGGLAKGHIVREIDILGGEMGFAADQTCIQFKRLNSKKGPAVRGSRAQCDKELYVQHMTAVVRSEPQLRVLSGEAKSLLLEAGGQGETRCSGVLLQDGSEIRARATVLTTGTFMRAVMHIGLEQIPGGRAGDPATIGISDQLRDFGFTVQRLKTGTPARLKAGSIDWSKTQEQKGDESFFPFSLRSRGLVLPQVSCWLSYTNERTHEVIRKNLDKSPMYAGHIEGRGPRYCPSIEDKVTRFAERAGHQTFLEPESLSTDWIYLQGISTSLPEDVQLEMLRTIPGLENVEVHRFGYAVEYDFFEPTQIRHSLETRQIENLFLAGQINGTSGYEEAAGQGLMAGINAVRKVRDQEALVLGRDESYIGVLIDDLVTKGTREPYRMFTSRAEHRMHLREDNTLDRLWKIGTQLGIAPPQLRDEMGQLVESRERLRRRLKEHVFVPNEETQTRLDELKTAKLLKPATAEELLRRPEMGFEQLAHLGFSTEGESSPLTLEAIEIDVKYAGYIERERQALDQTRRSEMIRIPEGLDFSKVRGLSREEIEKLSEKRPSTLGQASRLSGVNPSAIQALLLQIVAMQRSTKREEEISR